MPRPKPMSPMEVRLNAKAKEAVFKLVTSYNAWQEARTALLDRGALAPKAVVKNVLFYGPAVLEDQKRLGVTMCEPSLVEEVLAIAEGLNAGEV